MYIPEFHSDGYMIAVSGSIRCWRRCQSRGVIFTAYKTNICNRKKKTSTNEMFTVYVFSFLLIATCKCQVHFEAFEINKDFDNVFCDEGSTPLTTRKSLTQCTGTCWSLVQPLAGLFYDADTGACACRAGLLTDVGACVRRRGKNYQRKGLYYILHILTA